MDHSESGVDPLDILRVLGNIRQITATGTTSDDYLYDQAESVRPSSIGRHAFVTYQGHEYGPARITWGPLDGDSEKSTVLIQTLGGVWVKLWFFDKDLTPPNP